MDGGPRLLTPPAFAPAGLALAGLALVWAAMLWLGAGAADQAVLHRLHAGSDPGWTGAALLVTRLGDPDLLLAVSGLAALLLLARRDRRRAAVLLGISLSGRLLVNLLKAVIARPRPDAQLHLIETRTESFPSGHAACAVLVWLTLALLVPRESRWRKPALAASILASLGAGLSRPMLGVHWPSDVVAGWCLGLFWILLLTRWAGLRLSAS